MAKLKFKKGYSDVGVFPLLSHVLREGVLIVDDKDFDLNTSTSLTGEEKVKILQNGKAVLTTTQDIADLAGGGGGSPSGSDTQIQYNNAGAFGADAGFTRTSTGVTNISSTFGDETLQYQITDNLLGSGKHGILTQFTVPLVSLTDFTFSDGGDISSQKTLSYPSASTTTYSAFSYDNYSAKVTIGTDQGSLEIRSQESSLTKITDLDGINQYKTGFRTSGGSATIGDIDGGNNTKITIDDLNEQITISNLPAYDDDTAAGVGGLTAGMVYMTTGSGSAPLNAAGILMIKQ